MADKDDFHAIYDFRMGKVWRYHGTILDTLYYVKILHVYVIFIESNRSLNSTFFR